MDDSNEGVPFSCALNVGPSVESRGHDSALGAVPIHCCSVTFPKQDVLLEEFTKVISKRTDTIVVVVDDEPILTLHIQANVKRS